LALAAYPLGHDRSHWNGQSQNPSLFGISTRKVCLAPVIAARAVGSYSAFSPLPCKQGGLFSVVLSVFGALHTKAFLLGSTAPYVARTFLPFCKERQASELLYKGN